MAGRLKSNGRPYRIDWDADDRWKIAKHGYTNGENIDELCARLRVSRTALFRKLRDEGVPAREPAKGTGLYYRKIKSYPKAHPIVQALFKEARYQQVGLSEIAEATGVARETIQNWGLRSSPMLVNVEAAGAFLGLKLVWRRVGDGSQLEDD